jgi:hypothetical protein
MNTKTSALFWDDLPYAIGHPPPAALVTIGAAPSKEWQLKWRVLTCYALSSICSGRETLIEGPSFSRTLRSEAADVRRSYLFLLFPETNL